MDESAEPNKPPGEPPAPEVAALLKMLEREAAARRERRMPGGAPLQGNAFRYGVLIAIVVFAFGSLGMLEWLLSEMPRPVQKAAPVPVAGATPIAGATPAVKVEVGSSPVPAKAGSGLAKPAGSAGLRD
jgi:hypothetical protein